MRVGFHVTDRCQLDCDHCLRDPQQAPRDLPISVVERVLDEARHVYSVSHASLTGGEPTLHPELGALIDAIAARGFTFDLVTNGHRFERFVALLTPPRRVAFRSLTLSLDGATEATHDGIRGEGSYRDVMRAVSLCVAEALPFGLQMAIHARNEPELEAFGLLAAELGAKHVAFAMTQPTGTKHDVGLFLPAARWKHVQSRIERLGGVLRVPVIMAEGFWAEPWLQSCAPFRSETLHIDVEGRLTLCCLHSEVPAADVNAGVAGRIESGGLASAHHRLLGIIHDAQQRKLDSMERGELAEWDRFACNHCLKSFGKPHWTDAGASGPAAQRERWRGAWTPVFREPTAGLIDAGRLIRPLR